LLIV
jgi:crooked neck